MPLAIHRPAPRPRRRGPIRMRETVESVAWSSSDHRVRNFGDNPVTRCRKYMPRKAPFSKGRHRPQATLDLSLRTRPLHRAQVSRFRTTSLGRIEIRPSVPPGFDTLCIFYVDGKAFRQGVPVGHPAISVHRCFDTPYALAPYQDYWPKVTSQYKTQ